MATITVFGAGTWGIALARLLAVNGHDVTVWSALPEELKALRTTRRHKNLPGMELPSSMHYTADMAEACKNRDLLVFAVPSPFVRATAKKAAKYLPEGQLIVDVAKGVEEKTLATMSEVIEDEVQKPLGKAALTDLTAYMLSTVESWGVYALLYTGLWFGNTFLYMGGAALKPYDVWLAAYRTRKPAPGWPFGMWQYTSTAHIPGVVDAIPGKATNVDMSHAYKDYAGIISKKGLTRLREGK